MGFDVFGLALFYIIYLLFILLFQGTGTLYSMLSYLDVYFTVRVVYFVGASCCAY